MAGPIGRCANKAACRDTVTSRATRSLSKAAAEPSPDACRSMEFRVRGVVGDPDMNDPQNRRCTANGETKQRRLVPRVHRCQDPKGLGHEVGGARVEADRNGPAVVELKRRVGATALPAPTSVRRTRGRHLHDSARRSRATATARLLGGAHRTGTRSCPSATRSRRLCIERRPVGRGRGEERTCTVPLVVACRGECSEQVLSSPSRGGRSTGGACPPRARRQHVRGRPAGAT